MKIQCYKRDIPLIARFLNMWLPDESGLAVKNNISGLSISGMCILGLSMDESEPLYLDVDAAELANCFDSLTKKGFVQSAKALIIGDHFYRSDVERADKATVAEIVVKNVAKEAKLHTDESRLYTGADSHASEHNTVHHSSNEYVRGHVHTNTIEGYFSVFKKGMNGIFQHCQEKNLHRYLSEFDFKYNTRQALGYDDADRANMMLMSVVGKRLKYERPSTYA